MYVYVKAKVDRLWTVGFYDPKGRWRPESDYSTAREAADRVHWLNGGRQSEDLAEGAAE